VSVNGVARLGVRWSGASMYCRGHGGRACPFRRQRVQAGDASVSGELRVARQGPGRAEVVGVRRGTAIDACPCRARPCTGDVAMPLAAYLERTGRAPSGSCRRPLIQRRVRAISGDHGRRVWPGGSSWSGRERGVSVDGERGRHGHGQPCFGRVHGVSLHGLDRVGSRDHG
jgi:hypothetical protein